MTAKSRLDKEMVWQGLVATRSQSESFIKLGQVKVNNRVITKPGFLVSDSDKIELTAKEQYVSRAGLKLASVAKSLKLDFKGKVVLDAGSSTGGFTDYALKHGAKKVVAIDVGTDQLHPSLRGDKRIELHEKTDIRDFVNIPNKRPIGPLYGMVDIALVDVSFISLKEILPSIVRIADKQTLIVAMVKPQFEVGDSAKHKGVIKNDAVRRRILQDFEQWVKRLFVIVDKADSAVTGAKGNTERFYKLRKI